jgi:peptidoglycan/LPS O-acetylase OafA/YrhL
MGHFWISRAVMDAGNRMADLSVRRCDFFHGRAAKVDSIHDPDRPGVRTDSGPFLLGSFQADGVGRGLFALWLGGAYVLFAARAVRTPYWMAIVLTLAAAILYMTYVRRGAEYRLETYCFLLLFVFGVVAASQASRIITSRRVVGAINFVAGYSFTLYLIHHTLMSLVFWMWPGDGYGRFFGTVIASNLIAAAIASQTEMKHREFAQLLKRGLSNFAAPTAAKPAPAAGDSASAALLPASDPAPAKAMLQS